VYRIKKGKHEIRLVCTYVDTSYGYRMEREKITTALFYIYGETHLVINIEGHKCGYKGSGGDDYKTIAAVYCN